MGVYVYTLRKKTFNINGKPTAQYKYAYKPFWRDDESPVISRLHAAGERAAAAMKDIRQIVVGDVNEGHACTVYEIERSPKSASYDDFDWAKPVGTVQKIGRKLVFSTKREYA